MRRLTAIQKPSERNTQRKRGKSSASARPSAIAVVAWPEGKLAQLASPDHESKEKLAGVREMLRAGAADHVFRDVGDDAGDRDGRRKRRTAASACTARRARLRGA